MILKTKYSSMRSFWINRILRLYPIYLLIICLILLIDPNNFGKIFLDSSYSVLTRLYVFIYNIFMIGSDWSLWLEITPEKTLDFVMNFRDSLHSIYLKHSLLMVAWTISLEIYFYTIAPFLIKYPKKILVLLIILSLSLRFLFLYPLGFIYDPYTYRFFPTELVFFILGMFSYYYAEQFLKFGWIALTNVIILAFFIRKIPIDFRVLKLIYFISLTIAIPFLFKLFKNNVIDRKIGDLSYGIYLIHPLIISKLSFLNLSSGSYFGLVVVVSMMAASVLNIITSPIEIIRQKLAKDQNK
ncbi:MAG: acyltransferase [Spirochaetota bacterium]|nr:acyltransferase [Spirochaetota bacterium]